MKLQNYIVIKYISKTVYKGSVLMKVIDSKYWFLFTSPTKLFFFFLSNNEPLFSNNRKKNESHESFMWPHSLLLLLLPSNILGIQPLFLSVFTSHKMVFLVLFRRKIELSSLLMYRKVPDLPFWFWINVPVAEAFSWKRP